MCGLGPCGLSMPELLSPNAGMQGAPASLSQVLGFQVSGGMRDQPTNQSREPRVQEKEVWRAHQLEINFAPSSNSEWPSQARFRFAARVPVHSAAASGPDIAVIAEEPLKLRMEFCDGTTLREVEGSSKSSEGCCWSLPALLACCSCQRSSS